MKVALKDEGSLAGGLEIRLSESLSVTGVGAGWIIFCIA